MLAPRREGHHAFCFDSRADNLRCRRDLILGDRQVRARWTAGKFAQNPGSAGLHRGDLAAGVPLAWPRILANLAGVIAILNAHT